MKYAQRLYDGAQVMALTEVGQRELQGLSKDQVAATVLLIGEALDKVPDDVSLHVTLAAITYVRTALMYLMRRNEEMLVAGNGGTA